ncbi:hypothetical protein Nepgr_020892 [Nepenthes gracilis]|uniref:Legume lectin domain-containing protein n=1 Tax=Nepenthes gracilis TaxID=150966 RepID=A0AAD3XWT7_NEPGR|nr:hypothetical protein Nepgr_020892 [Nepenthes gracilis]
MASSKEPRSSSHPARALNASDNGTSPAMFAVEFDTVRDLEFDDINDNHVGIDLMQLDFKCFRSCCLHYLMGWSFKVGDEALSLDLSSSSPPSQEDKSLLDSRSFNGGNFCRNFVVSIPAYAIWKWKNRDVIEPWELDIGPQRFLTENTKATTGFRDEDLLGFGGSGRVYKGFFAKI